MNAALSVPLPSNGLPAEIIPVPIMISQGEIVAAEPQAFNATSGANVGVRMDKRV